MYVNVPTADQRTERGADGRPPEDGNMDCVAESLAKMAQALTGRALTGDGLHDAVYADGYIGMQDPARYVGYLAGLGLILTSYTGAPADLVAHAVACIRSGWPVLLSIPSDWGDQPPTSGYAHMVAGCDVDSSAGPAPNQTTLTAMNPWGGFYQTQSLAWWTERLATCAYKATWVMTRTGSGGTTGMAGIPSGWHDDGTTLTAPNGVRVVRGFRDHLLAAANWPAALVPLGAEFGIPNGTRQDFGLSLEWTAATAVTEHPAAIPPVPVPAPVPAPADPTAAPLRAALEAFMAQKA